MEPILLWADKLKKIKRHNFVRMRWKASKLKKGGISLLYPGKKSLMTILCYYFFMWSPQMRRHLSQPPSTVYISQNYMGFLNGYPLNDIVKIQVFITFWIFAFERNKLKKILYVSLLWVCVWYLVVFTIIWYLQNCDPINPLHFNSLFLIAKSKC